MRVDVSMTTDKEEFHIGSWWAKAPDFVVGALRAQLEAAQAIWPELREYTLVKKPPPKASQAARGAVGGDARAAALSPERRSEIAKDAANKRWGNPQNLTTEASAASPPIEQPLST